MSRKPSELLSLRIFLSILTTLLLASCGGTNGGSGGSTGTPTSCTEAKAAFDLAHASARALLATPANVGARPRPSPAEYSCTNSAKMAARDAQQSSDADAYEAQLNSPEQSAMTALSNTSPSAVACGYDASLLTDMADMAARMSANANQMAQTIQGEKNYSQYLGAIRAAVAAARRNELMGGDSTASMSLVTTMITEIADYSFDQVRLNHDFEYDLTTILAFGRQATLLGATGYDAMDIITRYQNLLKFSVVIDGTVNVNTGVGAINYATAINAPTISALYNSESNQFEWQPMPTNFTITGNGTMGTATLNLQTPFYNSPIDIEIKACDVVPTIKVKVFEFGPAVEVWQMCDNVGVCNSFPPPGNIKAHVDQTLQGFYEKQPILLINYALSGEPWYAFTLTPFTNKQPVLGDAVIANTSSAIFPTTASYHFKVTHTPP